MEQPPVSFSDTVVTAIEADARRWLAAGRYDGTLGLYSLASGGAGEQFVVPGQGKK